MSVSDEEPYSTIFASLKHPIRRRILRMLSKKTLSFSEMLEVLGVSSSFLTYHLENLGELVGKIDDGKYKLSSFGEAAMATMTKVEDIPTTVPQQSVEHSETRSHKWSGRLGIITRKFKMDEAKPKKMVRRSAAIALGIICILLIAFIAYFSITGISAQNSYNNLQNQNKQLQTWLDGNETLLNQTQANNTNLTNQVNDLTSTLNLDKSTVWVNNETISQPAGYYTDLNFSASYSGYVSVNVTSSRTDKIYVEVIYSTYVLNSPPITLYSIYGIGFTDSSYGINYDNTITLGTSGTAVFPVFVSAPQFFTISNNDSSLSNASSLRITAYFPTNIEIRVGNTNTSENATETVTITYHY